MTLEQYLDTISEMMVASYNSANIRPVETYIDHSGVECDVRTGLPIGSRIGPGGRSGGQATSRAAAGAAAGGSAATASASSARGNGYDDDFYDDYTPGEVGGSGYGFFDAGGTRTPKEDKSGKGGTLPANGSATVEAKTGKGFNLSVGRRLLDADR